MITPFLLIPSTLVRRFGIWVGLGSGFALWAIGSFSILQAALDVEAAIALNLIAFPICLYFSRPYLDCGTASNIRGGLMDIVLRALAVVSVDAAVIIAGRLIGPDMAGFIIVITIVWMSMAEVLYARAGHDATWTVMANGIGGMFGLCPALSALHLMPVEYGSTAALCAALALCVCWNLCLTAARPFIPMYNRAGQRPL